MVVIYSLYKEKHTYILMREMLENWCRRAHNFNHNLWNHIML